MENQEKVWNRIAPEWHEYKKIPSTLSKEFLERSTGNVLDLGSGSGRHLTKIKNGKYFLQDISNEMLKLADNKADELKIPHEIIHSPMDIIPKENDFFDYAICISALHCIETSEGRKKTIEELYRVLKSKGQAYIGVWNADSKRFKRKIKKGKEQKIKWSDKGERFYYLYNEDEIHELFKSTGFKIISTHNSEMMINFIVEK
jgi:ubiquinone/menaquinone biosynthesis C-methylase UbiE